MSLLSKYKNVIIALCIALAGFVVYNSFFKGGTEAALTAMPVNQNAAVEQDLIALLLELHSITLSEAIFTNPDFVSLQDFSQEIVPQPVGRPNPFSPLSGAAQTIGTGR